MSIDQTLGDGIGRKKILSGVPTRIRELGGRNALRNGEETSVKECSSADSALRQETGANQRRGLELNSAYSGNLSPTKKDLGGSENPQKTDADAGGSQHENLHANSRTFWGREERKDIESQKRPRSTPRRKIVGRGE